MRTNAVQVTSDYTCEQSLSSYNEAWITDDSYSPSFIHSIVEFYYGIYADTSVANSRYGLHAFVADIHIFLHKIAYVQFAVAVFLCALVATDGRERINFIKGGLR